MEVDIRNKKAIKRLLGQGIGYSLLTVSGEYGVQRIAIKKKLFKEEYTLYYFSGSLNNAKNDKLNSTNDSIDTTKVEIDVKNDGSLVIGGFAKFNIDNTCFVLKNPSRRLLLDGQTFRKVDEAASKRTHFDDSVYTDELLKAKDEEIKAKDEEIKDLNHTLFSQRNRYTWDRLEQAFKLGSSLIEIKERKKLDIKEYEYGREERKYVRTVYKDVNDNYKFGVSFIAKLLKENFKYSIGEDGISLCDEIISIDKKIDSIYYGVRNSRDKNIDFDSKISTISSLYGFIAADLRKIIFKLCDTVREHNTDTTFYEYKESGTNDYWDNTCSKFTHEIYWKEIENFFDSLIEGSAIFIERVTGEDIREEINKRLGKMDDKTLIKTNK